MIALVALDIANAATLRHGPVRGAEHAFICPRHDDQNPSLKINAKKNCWMCAPCRKAGNAWALAAFLAGVAPGDKRAIAAWLHEHGFTRDAPKNDSPQGKDELKNGRKRIVAAYAYVDESNQLLYQVVRFDPKSFGQRRPDGKGGWVWNIEGVRRVLYRLPEVLTAHEIFVVEGEKDADNLRGLGVSATCNPGGAGKWRVEYSHSFSAQQRIIIIPDNDDLGRKHAEQIAAALVGKVASAKILELAGLPPKGDISDWLQAGGTSAELEALAAAAPEFTPDDRGTLRFTSMRDFLNEPEEQVRWLVEDHLPAGGDPLLVAKPKVGKSTLARCLALAVARGEDFLGCTTTQGAVFYLALEEKRSEVRAHFRAMGARDNDPIFMFCATAPEDGLAQLREATRLRKPVLVLVDPLFRLLRMPDGNDYAAVTQALEPLHALARESGAHVLAVHHERKGNAEGGDGVLGSTALFAAVDTLLTMRRRDKYRTLSSIQRYGTDLDEITLEYDGQRRSLSAGVSRAEADEREVLKSILEYLTTQTAPVTERAIQDSVEGKRQVQVKALRLGVSEEKVSRSGAGTRGEPYLYFISGSLVPTYTREPEKRNAENAATDSTQKANTGSRIFDVSEACPEGREPVFDGENAEEFEL